MKRIFSINSKTWDKDIQQAYIDRYPGMELGADSPVMHIQADYIIDIDEMELSVILNWIDDQTEYGEVECEIMAALCEKYGVENSEDDSAAIVTLGQIKELAKEWEVEVETLMDQVDEI